MTHPLSRDTFHSVAVDLQHRLLTRQDLLGATAISYLRFSSAPQEKGTSIARQNETLDRIVAHFQLVRDTVLEDHGFSATKGRHRKIGKLKDLLDMVADNVIKPGTVLIIEAMDRLFREGIFDVFPVLETLIRQGGMILVTSDLTIWNEAAINSSLNHKLIAELNAARDYTVRLGQLARGAHANKRKLMEALVDDPNGKKPQLAGPPPAWILRENGACRLHPIHAETVRLIFRLYIGGFSTTQIAFKLNTDKVPLLGDKQRAGRRYADWRSTAVGRILRDDSVLGLVQPHHMVNGERIAIGAKVKVYPHAIEASDWLAARDLLRSRQRLRGRKGPVVANLFTGRICCGACGGAMRVDTGGTKDRIRKYQCASYVEGRTCNDNTRYDVPRWEPLIVDQIIERSRLVPRAHGNGQSKAAANAHAAVKIEIQQLDEQIAFVEPKIAKSATMAERWEQMCERRDALRAQVEKLAIEAQSSQSSMTRAREVHRFMRELRGPALRGDADARERLRSLLSRVNFKVVFGGTIPGGIDLTIGDWSDSFES